MINRPKKFQPVYLLSTFCVGLVLNLSVVQTKIAVFESLLLLQYYTQRAIFLLLEHLIPAQAIATC